MGQHAHADKLEEKLEKVRSAETKVWTILWGRSACRTTADPPAPPENPPDAGPAAACAAYTFAGVDFRSTRIIYSIICLFQRKNYSGPFFMGFLFTPRHGGTPQGNGQKLSSRGPQEGSSRALGRCLLEKRTQH